MKLKQIVQQYIISTIIILAIFVAIREINDNRPFKFENYNYESFKPAIQTKFPVGSDIDKVIEILVASDVQEIRISQVNNYIAEGTKPNAKYIVSFDYYASVVSLNPNTLYIIYTEVDENRKIIKITGSSSPWLEGTRW